MRLALFLAAVMTLLAGCGGLSSEPEIVREMVMPTTPPEVVPPVTAPDLALGAAFFAEHCAMCHGPGGRGDGSLVSSGQLQTAPPDFTDPSVVSSKTPMDYVRLITNGNMLAGMPPFGRFTPEERWAAAAYVYLGRLTAGAVERGAAIYEANCASCHGPEGRGDGRDAPAVMPDLTSPGFWAETSDVALVQKVTGGVNPGMHAFGDTLGEDEIRVVVGYLRTLAVNGDPGFAPLIGPVAPAPTVVARATEQAPTLANPASATAVPGTEVAAGPTVLMVTGQVTNGSAGGTLPAGVELTLHQFDPNTGGETSYTTTLNEDGSYTFADVPHSDGRMYLVSLMYNGVAFGSTVYTPAAGETGPVETAIEVYETATDPSVIQFDTGVMRISFSSMGMEVAEVLSVTNASDRIFLTDEHISDTQRVALRIPLPPGATGIAFEPGMQRRFVVAEDGMTVLDTRPVRPGSDTLIISYFLPYEDGAVIEQVFDYVFHGPFHLLTEAGQVTVEPGVFQSPSEQVDMGQRSFDAYITDLDLRAGEAFRFTITGRPNAAAASGAPEGKGLPAAVVILLIGGTILVGAGGFMFLLRQGAQDPAEKEIDNLLEEIATLDDQHEQGMINHDVYQQTRAELKARLAELMREDQDGDRA